MLRHLLSFCQEGIVSKYPGGRKWGSGQIRGVGEMVIGEMQKQKFGKQGKN